MNSHNICYECKHRTALYLFSESPKPYSLCVICFHRKYLNAKDSPLDGLARITRIHHMHPKENEPENSSAAQLPESTLPERKVHSVQQANDTLYCLQFGEDLTTLARSQNLDPVIGRKEEVEKLVRILTRRQKNNPVLIGDPGVGKTAILEGLAQRIVNKDIPSALQDKRIISLSMGSVIAGTKYRGQFEERMKKIVEEVTKREDLLLFIDEIHTIAGKGGGADGIDASQILKPSLSRGKVQIIGATTFDEYRTSIEKDRALDRRFQQVKVEEPSAEDTFAILQGGKHVYEKHHQVSLSDEVLKEAILLAKKYLTNRTFPDKAFDLIDEAAAHTQLHSPVTVTEKELIKEIDELQLSKEDVLMEGSMKDVERFHETLKAKETQLDKKRMRTIDLKPVSLDTIAFILEEWTGIPASKMTKSEVTKLKGMAEHIEQRVKGQNEAIHTLTDAVKRNMVGLKPAHKPVGVFMMLGPTGVGKTELAKSLAETLFDDERALVRIDMSEYMDSHSTSKLIGAPPGYVGFSEEGQLTRILREKPYSVVLLDEIEKAHPDVTNLLLQLYDEGRITNGSGKTFDASNCLFLMTSNIGSDLYSSKQSTLGFQMNDNKVETLKPKVMERLKSAYRPEFLNRIDDFILFNPLTEDVMRTIVRNMLESLNSLLGEQNRSLNYTDDVVDVLVDNGFDKEYGARPLERELNKTRSLIATHLLDNEKSEILLSVSDNEILITKEADHD